MSPWLLLTLAIVAEVIGSASLRASEGFTKLFPSLLVALGYAAAFYLMGQILKQLPLGLTYAVWSGVGTALTAIIGWTFFRDAFQWTALGGIALIILGVVVLNIGSSGNH